MQLAAYVVHNETPVTQKVKVYKINCKQDLMITKMFQYFTITAGPSPTAINVGACAPFAHVVPISLL